MNSAQGAVLGAVAGACLAGVVAWTWQTTEMPVGPLAAPPASGTGVPAAVSPAPVATAADLSPITNRLDELAEGLRRLEAKLDRVTASPERTPAIDNAKVMLDADTLQLAMEEVERKKIEALSDDALRNQAWQLMKAGDDPAGAVQRLQMLLERELTPERRVEITTELGMMQRSLGGKEGLEASARTLQSVIDAQGMQSRLGVAAAHQLIWTLSKSDPARALAVADAATRSAGATPEQRINSRWAAAIVSQQLGDVVRARADYQGLLRDLAGQPDQQKLVADIERRLRDL
ncbi:MAG TPA: hypothetical protein VFZ65_04445 [Planctomycetota bacterium]|nr:hypothetical protein [Planctomycetota bacterium]